MRDRDSEPADDTNIIDRLAAPDSLLGMLQRGRGAGYLAALNAPRETVWPLLIECITNDPRLDQDCEDRSEYYGALILATGMDLAPLSSHLQLTDSEEVHLALGHSLPLDTIGHLAARGSDEAVQILRDYISYGRDWVDVFDFLSDLDEIAAWDGMNEVLFDRIARDSTAYAQFKAEVEDAWRWYCSLDAERRADCTLMLPICGPWKALCERDERFADLFQGVGIAYDQPPPPKEKPTEESIAGLSLDELFDAVDESNWWLLKRIVPEKVSPEDEGWLIESLPSDNKWRVGLALRGLGELGTTGAFQAVKAFIEDGEDRYREMWPTAFQAIAEMPGHLTLETARQWFHHKEHRIYYPAGMILEKHATLEDVPLLVEALRTPETVRHEDFRLGTVLTALARFEGIGLIPEIEQIFRETPGCFDRYRAAKAMAVTAPDHFRSRYAFECLWDCHWDTRGLGCETVSLSAPGALERLREIAEDAGEDDKIRQAAQERLEGF